jgi:hypothetical protein
MAGQRWGQFRGHGCRRGGRLRGLGRALSLTLVIAACSGEADGPDPLHPGGDRPGTSGSGVLDGGLVGSWRNVTVVQVPGDLQTWITVWRFESDGGCRQTVETESLAEGFPRVTERSCTYLTAAGSLTISYLGSGTSTFDYSFAGFSPNRLILDGFEYQRIS